MSGKQHDFKIYLFKEFLNEVAVQIYCQAIIKTVVLLDQRRNSQSLTFFFCIYEIKYVQKLSLNSSLSKLWKV